ncbi:MAG: hypothetical protein H0V54_12885 [Chthoniobacterales bacterium]|nr:hypothetical protein [Chthoniobacterales bacterium]
MSGAEVEKRPLICQRRHLREVAAGESLDSALASWRGFDNVEHVSLEQLEDAILGLSPDERQRLALWFEDNRRELLGSEPDELSDEQRAEVLRRRDLALANPELLEPWDGTVERVRARLNEFRRKKTAAS